jgi:hypothetical protein
VGLPSALIIFAGHMAVVIGLWPVHVFGTYRTLAMYGLHVCLLVSDLIF